jgi:hypothetical protein
MKIDLDNNYTLSSFRREWEVDDDIRKVARLFRIYPTWSSEWGVKEYVLPLKKIIDAPFQRIEFLLNSAAAKKIPEEDQEFLRKLIEKKKEERKEELKKTAQARKEKREKTIKEKKEKFSKLLESLPQVAADFLKTNKRAKIVFFEKEIFSIESIMKFLEERKALNSEKLKIITNAIYENYTNRGISYKYKNDPEFAVNFETEYILEKVLNAYARHNLTDYDFSPGEAKGEITEIARDSLKI